MRFLLSLLGVLAALIMLAVSGSMNYLFMSSFGKTAIEAQAFGGASAAADMLKAMLPFWISWALRDRRIFFVAIGSSVFVFFTAFSFASALGFAADNRGAMSGSREGLNANHASVVKDISEVSAKRTRLPVHRASSVVEHELQRLKQNRRWSSTKQCADGQATASKSRIFCGQYFTMRAELAAAIEDTRLSSKLETLKSEARALQKAGAGKDVDPQVSILSRLLGQDRGFIRNTMIVVVAALVEIGSSLGLFLATGHSDIFKKRGRKTTPSQVEQSPVQSGAKPAPAKRLGSGVAVSGGQGITGQGPRGVAALVRDTKAESAKMMGDIEDYCLERLQPAANGGLTLPELFRDYESWCAQGDLGAARQGDFAADFERIADQVGIDKNGALYEGVTLVGAKIAQIG